MPLYEYYCDGCGCAEAVLRPVSECSADYGCFNCGATMIRVYSAPAVLNRSKPRGFKTEFRNLSAWDSRLHHLRHAEAQGGAQLQKIRGEVGEKLYQMTLKHKKDNYA